VAPTLAPGYSLAAMRRLLLAPLLAGPLLAAPLLVTEAAAQTGIGRSAPPPAPSAAQRPPPPALPGLAGRRAVEPIPAEPNVNLAPNEALFDAVNRGDLAAAREAVGRGADLNSRNQLGLTPVDAAVDQGRNEIVFYLLSARGSTGTGPTTAAAEPAPPPPPARRGRPGREAQAARGAAPAAEPAPEPIPVAPPPRLGGQLSDPPRALQDTGERASSSERGDAAPTARARLFAGDGGAPRPEIGFLGFDAGRPAGAAPAEETRPARRGARRA